MKKLHKNNRVIFVACVKTTNNYRHYVAYLDTRGGLSLLAPCGNEKEAKAIGMTYNPPYSGLPPYTMKAHYTNCMDRVLRSLNTILLSMKMKGNFEVYELSGYLIFAPKQLLIN